MKKYMIILALLVGCSGSSGGGGEGNPAVYDRIAAETDCTALQAEFDQAMDNAEAREPGDPLRDISLAYADAADARLSEVGCY